MVDPKPTKNAAEQLSEEEVSAFLVRHPNFLAEHSELLGLLTPPSHRQGDNVVDMQHFMLNRLQADLQRVTGQQRDLISTSRSNLSSQQRVHGAVLALIAATSFEQLIQAVTTDLSVLLDVDVVTLCIESSDRFARPPMVGIQLLSPGEVDTLLGRDRDVLLEDEVAGDPAIFGSGAGLVHSEALLRLAVANAPPGMLALGSRRLGKFKAGQGTELLSFLARTLEITISQWLAP
ncbi:MAG TPA: DUF484 family protein [Aliidongia sp.]|nr:DUF484 family protein [Aliidongia sp.]